MIEGMTTAVLRINGEDRMVAFPTHHTLLEVLREECALPGTKHGCELGECGTCTVLIDKKPALACLLLAAECEGREIETVEGLWTDEGAHPLQTTFAELGAAQCGYCTPGILMAAKSLLAENEKPSDPEIREALSGNLCRCTGYNKIIEAIQWAGSMMRGEDGRPTKEQVFGSEEAKND